MFSVAALQMTSGTDVKENLKQAKGLIQQAVSQQAQLVVLPENFALMGKTDTDKLNAQESLGSGLIQDFLAQQALQHRIWVVGGTIPLRSPIPAKLYNACLVYNEQGQRVACYNKIHLFDAHVKPEKEIYQESKLFYRGDQVVVLDTPVGRLGLAICYDIRFPELFRKLLDQGAEIIAIPSAFTVKTGEAHWEVLTRARAIENFCYLIGACQTGAHQNGRTTYGHSLIINPWGSILACLPNEAGIITAEISLEYLYDIRTHFPAHQHRIFPIQ